ncbi:MAG: hypothetical protein KGK07_14465 [Chloroflexota bacterium]|nr:hypothetical protein [Chloroflexota bacterium]
MPPIPDRCPVCLRPYTRRSSLQQPGGPCPRCRQRANARATLARRIASGRCRECGLPAPPGRRTCDACLRTRTARARERKAAPTQHR